MEPGSQERLAETALDDLIVYSLTAAAYARPTRSNALRVFVLLGHARVHQLFELCLVLPVPLDQSLQQRLLLALLL